MAISLEEFHVTPHETYAASELRLLYRLFEEKLDEPERRAWEESQRLQSADPQVAAVLDRAGRCISEFRFSRFDGASLIFFTKDDANPSSIVRLNFTPLDRATVRQHSESSSDGGKSWTTQYNFCYHRKAN